MADDREYREAFRFKTEADRIDQARANVERAAERFHLKLDDFTVTLNGNGRAMVEVTVSGKSADLTKMRENVMGEVSVFGRSASTDLADIVWDFTVGPALDLAATRARRGWWAVKRRRRQQTDETFPDVGP
jgi:hypothetical protein